jgi:intracellular septation protein
MAVVFGGASLLLHDPNILKMKMTIFDGLLGAALIGGVWLRKNPLKMLLGGAIVLGERAWAVLSIRYALFFWGCAIANEIVRRTQTDTTWGMFRVAVLPAAVIFALSQTPFMMKHGKVGKAVDLSEPPRSGP